ncbi:MAG: glycerate kinase [Anaerolineaceae bacterium]
MDKQLQFATTYLENIPIAHEISIILNSAFASVDPINAVMNAVRFHHNNLEITNVPILISSKNKIFVWGLGKASQKMAIGLKTVFHEEISTGAVITKHSSPDLEKMLLPNIITFEGDHPIPSEKSRNAAENALKRLGKLKSGDTVLTLISGGGSSLAVLPRPEIDLEDYQRTTQLLLECGANIQEINIIRKQLDQIKGGGLIKLLYPANIVSLILSDVVGDQLDVIASGPTVFSTSTKQDAWLVIEKYDLSSQLPEKVCLFLKSKFINSDREVLKTRDEQLVYNILIGNNRIAANAAKKAAEDMGFKTEVVSTTLQGEAREVGLKLGAELKRRIASNQNKSCWIYGGETTVIMHGNGKGGRNQELILAAAQEIADLQNGCILSIATDGEDGPTDAAGAIADGNTIEVGRKLGLDIKMHLENNDAYSYFNKVGGLIRTGPSGTNVNDLVFLFAY